MTAPRRLAPLALAVVVPLLASCGTAAPATTAPTPVAAVPAPQGTNPAISPDAAAKLAKYDLTGKTPEEIVQTLDQDPRKRPLPLKASVRSDEVLVSDGDGQVSIPLTSDKFYLSIAPYQTRTHECFFHNLGTCQGELGGKQVHVRITDADGQAIVDTDATTYANGFVAFWVPRNIHGTVEVSYEGTNGSTPFASGKDDATCVTTLKMS